MCTKHQRLYDTAQAIIDSAWVYQANPNGADYLACIGCNAKRYDSSRGFGDAEHMDYCTITALQQALEEAQC